MEQPLYFWERVGQPRLLRTLYELLISSLRFAVSNEYGGGKPKFICHLSRKSPQNNSPNFFTIIKPLLTLILVDICKDDPGASWEATPENERKVMIAAARLTLLELISPHEVKPNSSYFAKPGEAEWGC